MRRTVATVLLLGPALVVPPPGAGQELGIRLAWPEGLAVACSVPLGAARLELAGGAGPGGTIEFAAGLDGPVVRVGPLAEAGLLRVAAGPLGFGPGSDVATEATGLRLPRPPAAAAARSIQVTIVPDLLAVFLREPLGEGGALGGVIGPVRVGALALDAAAVLAGPGAADPGTAWYRDSAPSPRGRALWCCGRIRLGLPALALAAVGGASFAERAPPGGFALGMATVGRGATGVDLLAAVGSPDYLEAGGGDDPGGVRTGVRLRLACPGGRLVARWVLDVDAPGFVAGPWLHSVEDLDLSIERKWPAAAGTWEAELAASNRIETAGDGTVQDDPSGSLAAGWRGRRSGAGISVTMERETGIAVEAGVDAAAPDGRTVGDVALRCSFPGGAPRLQAVAGVRVAWGGWDISAEAGTGAVPLVRGGLRSARPRFSLSFAISAAGRGEARAP